MESLNRFLDKANEGYTEKIDKLIYNEYGYFLQISGSFVNLTPKWRYFSVAQEVFHLAVLIIGFYLYAISTVKLINIDITLASQAGHIFCGMIFALFMFVVLTVHRKRLMVFFQDCSENFYSYGKSFVNKELETWNTEMKKFKVKTVKALALYVAIVGFYAMVGIPILNSYQDIGMEGEVDGIHLYLPVPMYIPFHANFWGKLSGYILELGNTVALTGILSSAILLIIFALETFIIQLKILLLSIKKLEERALNQCWIKYKKRLYPKSCYEDGVFLSEYNLCIKQNVEHHKIIIRSFEIINDIQKWPMMAVVILISVVLALSLFILIQGETRIGPQILSMLLIGIEAAAIATLCSRAQKVIELGEDVFMAFYHIKWMYCNKCIKNSILIINECTRSPLVLKAGGLTQVDMELFASICNSVYSYFNLLLAAQNKI